MRIPFTTALLKNRAVRRGIRPGSRACPLCGLRPSWSHLSPEYRVARDALAMALTAGAIRSLPALPKGAPWRVEIRVGRPDYRSDPVGLQDGILDAAQNALGLDDRYAEASVRWVRAPPGDEGWIDVTVLAWV